MTSRPKPHSYPSREELEALVREYRHLLEEHRRAEPDSSVRRHLENRLLEVGMRFEHLLDEWVPGEELRAAWRAHLHEGAPEPAEPEPVRPLVFYGVAETGSVVEVRERRDGELDVAVDGSLVERIAGLGDFASTEAPVTFKLAGSVFDETFSASAEALDALDAFVAGRERTPPWRFAVELAADGLVDRYFGLTPRGHRALRQRGRRSAAG